MKSESPEDLEHFRSLLETWKHMANRSLLETCEVQIRSLLETPQHRLRSLQETSTDRLAQESPGDYWGLQ